MELTGRLTADAKVSEVKGGKKVVNFSIAINDSYKPKDGERVELTTYVECAYWLNAKVGEYLKKGLLVQLYGRMGSRAWVNKDGDAKSSLTCNIANLKFWAVRLTAPAQNRVQIKAIQQVKMTTCHFKGDNIIFI
ncbi:single-stranded DNA-binding protein [Mucilaginibacter sp.]|uniref:single-stranded DNA-binding protein n=1 Tax=Mucilaginibacter sp. TaxID=1882438 RepID=UPI003D12D995